MTIIKNARIVSGSGIKEGCVAYQNGVIVETPLNTVGAEVIDAKGAYLSAGFIDLHTHGGGGYDFMDGTVEAFLGAAELHARHGTTTLLPTATSGTLEETSTMFDILTRAQAENVHGADMPGLHLEGPYFSPAQAGAQDPRFLKEPKPEEYLPILHSTDKILRWSAACELDGAFDFAEACRDHGVLCAIGHSDADLATVEEAIKHGFTHLTHFYSGMSSVHRVNAYRVCGVVEAGYLRDDLTVEIIADGCHLPKGLLQMIYRFIGPDRICLITDSMRGAGMPDGTESILGSLTNGQKVIIEDGVAKMPDRASFAGSVATADRLLNVIVNIAEIPLYQAIKMLTETPARIQHLYDRGTLDIGKRADIVLFNDELKIIRTIVGGYTVFCKDI